MAAADAANEARLAAAEAAKKMAAEKTKEQIAAGVKSTDRSARLPGETASEANARITEAYKTETVKPILTPEQIDAGMTVQYVRTGAGGFGEYAAIKPIGYNGPTEITSFTEGIVPKGSKYTTTSNSGTNPVTSSTSTASTSTASTSNTSTSSTSTSSTSTASTNTASTSGLVAGGITADTRNAFAVMTSVLRSYGLESLANVMTQLMTEGLGAEEALSKVKYDKSVNPKTGKAFNADYEQRFYGNTIRTSKGLNAISEAEYLYNENQYAETLKSYGFGNMLSLDRTVNEKKFADYMGNDMSPTEFKDRIDLTVTRVTNMDPAIKKNFQDFYPSLTNQDLISYFLDPAETLPALKMKVQSAEIGAAFNQQNLSTDKATAEMYSKQGVDYGQAQLGAKNIKSILDDTTKLSDIYQEDKIGYNQKVAEEEYLGQSAEAKLKRNRLASKERASYSGDSGLGPDGQGLARSAQGVF